jgi:signal transduction histidine kinase
MGQQLSADQSSVALGETVERRRLVGASVSPASLRVVSMLADLTDDELGWIAARSERIELAPGEILFSSGEPADWMFFALEGVLQARREQLGPGSPVYVFRAGDVGGTIPFSRMVTFTGTGRAITRAVIVRFPKDEFPELLRRLPALTQRFVSHLADRVRDATRRDAQFEKLTALGTLSAGLAHELNNPTAALLRNVADARHRLDERGRLTAALVDCRISADAVRRLDALRRRAATRPADADAVDTLTRSDREDALARWLGEELGIADPWVHAATFVEAGIDQATLSAALADVPAAGCAPVVEWLETGLAAQALFASAEQAAGRIARLVDAVRTYTHRDRMRDMTDVDIRDGLESALALLSSRAREKGVALVRDFANDLPRVRAYPGELNQAWSSLLDNALDAAPRSTGRIVVRTGEEDGMLVAEVRDNGRGIPAQLQERVFEPFFTTKDVGEGAGLGLDIARRVVVDLHGGQLTLTSVPGDTRFIVRLPLTTISTFGT